jgi:hypothetical protein
MMGVFGPDTYDVNVQKAFAEIPTGDLMGDPYSTTKQLVRGNAGERLAAFSLSSEGYDILMYKPDIIQTNRPGVDIVAMKDGVVYLIDNKALSRSGSVNSVSALTTNFANNLPKVREQLVTMSTEPNRPVAEQRLLLDAIDSLDFGRFQRVVTNANILTQECPYCTENFQTKGPAPHVEENILTNVTPKLRSQGIEFINVFQSPKLPPQPLPSSPALSILP